MNLPPLPPLPPRPHHAVTPEPAPEVEVVPARPEAVLPPPVFNKPPLMPPLAYTPAKYSEEYESRAQDKTMLEAYHVMDEQMDKLKALISEKVAFTSRMPINAINAYKAAVEAAEDYVLDQHPLEELAQFPLSIPLSQIKIVKQQFGATTMKSVKNMIPSYIDDAKNIGPAKAEVFYKATQSYIADLKKKTHVDLKMGNTDKRIGLLLSNLHLLKIYANKRTNEPEVEELLSFGKRLEASPLPIDQLRGFTYFLFPRSDSRVQSRRLLARSLNEWETLPTLLALSGEVTRQDQRIWNENAAGSYIYDDFIADSATYYSLLSRLMPAGTSADVDFSEETDPFAGGGLGKDIWDEINDIELNLSRFKASLRPYQEFGVKYCLHQKRTLLGDDMGLGKTVQAIAVMAHISATSVERPTHLVVAPLSVQANWVRELNTHSSLKTVAIRSKDQRVNASNYDVIITTYERISESLRKQIDGAVIVDEAHLVKNPETQRAQRVLAAIGDREYAMFMTGTAIENNLEELSRLIELVNPNLSKDLDALSATPTPQAYRGAIAFSYLRRNKEDVLTELPELTVKDEWVEMGAVEEEYYKRSLEVNWHATRKVGYARMEFSKLTRMAEIILASVAKGEKILIFSYYLEVLDTVSKVFKGIPQVRVDGSVDAEGRQNLVDDFNKTVGTKIFLSQINTGGVGLNLQSASRIILCEPQIKFSLETQAIARAHRMGQLNPVIAHRLATTDTLDERIVNLRNEKERLFDEYAKRTAMGDMSLELEDEGKSKRLMLAEERLKYGVTVTPVSPIAPATANGTPTAVSDME